MRFFSIFWIQFLIALPLTAQESEIARVFTEEDTRLYAEATNSYLEWIGQAADPNVGDLEELRQHLRWIALITPDESKVNTSANLLISNQGIQEDASKIVSWWHQQDPLPATLYNERIEEHLYRVYYAQRQYAHRRDSLGVDDRGRIFVRFGKPWREAVITLQNPRLTALPLEIRLPRNEIWVYRGIHDDAHYLFTQMSRRRPYRIDTPESLIPPNLRGSRRRVSLLLDWMEEIYGQLAMEHPHYGIIYDTVVNYTSLATSSPLRPYEFSQKAIQDSRTRDDQHQLSRARTLPTSTTNVYGNAIQLKPQIRFSRFLEKGGATRLEIYWKIDFEKLRPSRSMVIRTRQLGQERSSDFILNTALTKRAENFAPQNIQIRRYHLAEGTNTKPRIYSWIAPDYSSLSSLAMQWSLHWTVPDSIPPQPAATWAIGVEVLDQLQPLRGDRISLEMSDLKPLRLQSSDTFDGAIPYVDQKISPDTPFGLYFEIYFLQFNENDQTNYTVEYALSGNKQPPIATSFEYEGDDAMVREFIVVDIGRWKTPGPFSLTLKVTDHNANTSVSRSVDFEYVE